MRVQPRASRSEVAGLCGDEIRVRIAAPPVDGAANEALVQLLADRLGVPRSAVEVVAGAAARRKIVRVARITPSEAARQLGIAGTEPGP